MGIVNVAIDEHWPEAVLSREVHFLSTSCEALAYPCMEGAAFCRLSSVWGVARPFTSASGL